MSEIEKLYENAGINKIGIKRCSGIKQGICQHNCNECESFDYKYPPFTAEKQLEILCFIVNNKHSVTFHDQVFRGDKLTLEKIQENLAWAINRIWQDLSEEEKQQVKGILE